MIKWFPHDTKCYSNVILTCEPTLLSALFMRNRPCFNLTSHKKKWPTRSTIQTSSRMLDTSKLLRDKLIAWINDSSIKTSCPINIKERWVLILQKIYYRKCNLLSEMSLVVDTTDEPTKWNTAGLQQNVNRFKLVITTSDNWNIALNEVILFSDK